MEEGERMKKLVPIFVKISMSFGCIVILLISWLCGIAFIKNWNLSGLVDRLFISLLTVSLILVSIGIILIMYHIWENGIYE